jgi:molecular chaperone GrpE (heat shock protein)
MKTAMQELKSDLLTAIDTCNEALEEIKDLRTREACQAVVNLTIDNILNRIDTELLAMEKEQIIDAYNTSFILRDKPYSTAEKYYKETFKSE